MLARFCAIVIVFASLSEYMRPCLLALSRGQPPRYRCFFALRWSASRQQSCNSIQELLLLITYDSSSVLHDIFLLLLSAFSTPSNILFFLIPCSVHDHHPNNKLFNFLSSLLHVYFFRTYLLADYFLWKRPSSLMFNITNRIDL